LPSAQSLGPEHARPFGLSAWQEPPLQKGAVGPHCSSPAHVAKQAVPSQPYPSAQVRFEMSGQRPVAQDAAMVCAPAVHVSARQDVVGYVQLALAAAHAPPHVVPAPTHLVREPCGWPDATCVHLPSEPVTLHALHCSVHAPLQHNPSTQKLDVHCAFAVQMLPSATLPHDVSTQGWPMQSVSAVHAVAHNGPAHLNGAQVTVRGGVQVPAPSHLAASLSSFLVASHAPAAQVVPLG
jgi:hypothetical protein